MDELDYEEIVGLHADDLYRFAFSLTSKADEAGELTQETYCRLLTKGGQLRDRAKVKSWLFTTLYRVFLGWKRHESRHPHLEIESVAHELPVFMPATVDAMDGETIMARLLEIEERYRTPLTLFYLQDLAYRDIAELLELPVGTVMSRLSRGKDLLRQRISIQFADTPEKIIPIKLERLKKTESL